MTYTDIINQYNNVRKTIEKAIKKNERISSNTISKLYTLALNHSKISDLKTVQYETDTLVYHIKFYNSTLIDYMDNGCLDLISDNIRRMLSDIDHIIDFVTMEAKYYD